ncbi:MAG: NADH-quinone oxidoreductase subunit F [SAR202 cluster bacterium]|nr:NADH-quinone oxidoreductase subunit F [SAR202 cluster bacterium]|tara:strand:+ start:1002 stop:2702 length:1701 start_codon:yes stop_codon:yes gene_type:complete
MQKFIDLKKTAQSHYDNILKKPRIRVGTDISGVAAGSLEISNEFSKYISEKNLDTTLSHVGGFGLSYAEPLIDVEMPDGSRVFYSNVSIQNVKNIVESHIINGKPLYDIAFAYTGNLVNTNNTPEFYELPENKLQKKILTENFGHIDPTDIYEYIVNNGYSALAKALFEMEIDNVHKEILDSKLRGRGGAAFPTGVKLGFLKGSDAKEKYILCNCEEGDPGAWNDKAILESDPHRLLEGLILAAIATNASNGIIFIRHGNDIPIERTKEAVKNAYEHGLLGKNILGSEFSFDAEVVLVGESYVAGEETALMEAIEGKRAMPRYKPPFPAAFGVWGHPSNINNIKTIANLPSIILKGSEWFTSIGTDTSTGTAILCLSGNINKPGLYEIEMGTTIRSVIEDICNGIPDNKELKLLQTGGPLGGVLNSTKLDTSIDFDSMAKAGAILGSGGIIVADEDVDVVDLTRMLIAFCQFESCGKCFPCRLGNSHLLEILNRICGKNSSDSDIDLMRKVGTNMQQGSLCGHGQLGFNPIKSALEYFKEDFDFALDSTPSISNTTINIPTRANRY